MGERRGERRGGSEGEAGSAMLKWETQGRSRSGPGAAGLLALISGSVLSLQVCQEAERIGRDRGQGTTSERDSVI